MPSISSLSLARALGAGATLAMVAGLAAAPPAGAATDPDCPGMAAPAAVTTGAAPVLTDDAVTTLAGGILSLHPLANDTGSHPLAIVKVGDTTHGDTCLQADGTLQYISVPAAHGYTETISYGVTDGNFYRVGTITVTVTPDADVVPVVVRRLHGSKPARLRFTNTNTRAVRLLVGSRQEKKPDVRRTIAPGATTVVTSRRDKLVYVASLRIDGLGGVPLTVGTVNNRTGRVRSQDVGDLISSLGRDAARSAVPWH